MRKFSLLLTIISMVFFSIVLLSGCSKSDTSEKKFDYAEVNTILAEQNTVPDHKLDNLILPDRVIKADTDKVYTFISKLSTEVTDDQKDYIKSLLTKFVGSYDESKFMEQYSQYNYDDDHCAAFISAMGCFGIVIRENIQMEIDDPRRVQKTEIEKIIHPDRGDSTDLTYNVGGKELSLEDAIKMADEAWEKADLKSRLKSDEKIQLKYAVIKKYTFADHVEYGYTIYWSVLKNGVPLAETGGIPNSQAFPYNTYAVTEFLGRPEVTQIRLDAYIDSSDAKEYTGKLITLESAIKQASEYLAEYKKYTVPEIGMVYCAIASGTSFTELDYRPMWRIILEEDQEKINVTQLVLALYIDMTNGDMYLFDDRKGEMLGTKKGNVELLYHSSRPHVGCIPCSLTRSDPSRDGQGSY